MKLNKEDWQIGSVLAAATKKKVHICIRYSFPYKCKKPIEIGEKALSCIFELCDILENMSSK